jgi:hypothetical protein
MIFGKGGKELVGIWLPSFLPFRLKCGEETMRIPVAVIEEEEEESESSLSAIRYSHSNETKKVKKGGGGGGDRSGLYKIDLMQKQSFLPNGNKRMIHQVSAMVETTDIIALQDTPYKSIQVDAPIHIHLVLSAETE